LTPITLREFVLINAATRQVEVFTRAEEGVWQFMDQSSATELFAVQHRSQVADGDGL